MYDRIVYMGAACTVQEFADQALPYIKQHAYTRFYNLCLHPVEEANDRYGWGVLPFGSLLDWIGNYITDRESALDGTLGKWLDGELDHDTAREMERYVEADPGAHRLVDAERALQARVREALVSGVDTEAEVTRMLERAQTAFSSASR